MTGWDDGIPEGTWRKGPPTEKQLTTLRRLGCPTTPENKGEASDLLEQWTDPDFRWQARLEQRPASALQCRLLRELGCRVSPGSFWEAGQLITYWKQRRSTKMAA